MFTNVEEANKQIENIKEKLEAIHKASHDKSESIIKLSNDLKQVKEAMGTFGEGLNFHVKDETYKAIQEPFQLLNQKLLSVEIALLATELEYVDVDALKKLNNAELANTETRFKYMNLLSVQTFVGILNNKIEKSIKSEFKKTQDELASHKSRFEKLKTSIPNLEKVIAEKDESELAARTKKNDEEKKLKENIEEYIYLIQRTMIDGVSKNMLSTQVQGEGNEYIQALRKLEKTLTSEKNKVFSKNYQEQFENIKTAALTLFPGLEQGKITQTPKTLTDRRSIQETDLGAYISETEKKLRKTWPRTTERKFFEECVRRGKDLMQEMQEMQEMKNVPNKDIPESFKAVELIEQKFAVIKKLDTPDGLKKDLDNKIEVFKKLLNGELKNNQDQFSPEKLAMKKKCTEYQGKFLKLNEKIKTASALYGPKKNTKLKECILEISDMEREFAKSSASIKKRFGYGEL